MTADSESYVCPQCGPDNNGSKVHAETHHTFPNFGEEWDKAVYGESTEEKSPEQLEREWRASARANAVAVEAIRAAGIDPELFNDGSIPSDVRAELIQLRAVVEGLAAQQAAVHSFGAQLWTEIQPLLEHVKPMLDEIQGSYLYRAFVAKRGKR